ncbi:hypothetical protein B0H10DRAFT_1948339 [Mycena sp. CBHHK59/15]|nr:hypothetical protein B0H10DRAFT_1948339 [Mycena sp. CBHHK59/15]
MYDWACMGLLSVRVPRLFGHWRASGLRVGVRVGERVSGSWVQAPRRRHKFGMSTEFRTAPSESALVGSTPAASDVAIAEFGTYRDDATAGGGAPVFPAFFCYGRVRPGPGLGPGLSGLGLEKCQAQAQARRQGLKPGPKAQAGAWWAAQQIGSPAWSGAQEGPLDDMSIESRWNTHRKLQSVCISESEINQTLPPTGVAVTSSAAATGFSDVDIDIGFALTTPHSHRLLYIEAGPTSRVFSADRLAQNVARSLIPELEAEAGSDRRTYYADNIRRGYPPFAVRVSHRVNPDLLPMFSISDFRFSAPRPGW